MVDPRTARQPGREAESRRSALRPSDTAVRRALVESQRPLLSYLARRLRSPEAAAEVLQMFALRALQRSGGLRDAQRVRGWLARVLATTIADYQRVALRARRREIAL